MEKPLRNLRGFDLLCYDIVFFNDLPLHLRSPMSLLRILAVAASRASHQAHALASSSPTLPRLSPILPFASPETKSSPLKADLLVVPGSIQIA